jgi:hypothetical protein
MITFKNFYYYFNNHFILQFKFFHTNLKYHSKTPKNLPLSVKQLFKFQTPTIQQPKNKTHVQTIARLCCCLFTSFFTRMSSGKHKRAVAGTLTVALFTFFSIILLKDVVRVGEIKNQSLRVENYKTDEERMLNASSRQIFFLETHLERVRSLDKPRQVCSVEAAGEEF